MKKFIQLSLTALFAVFLVACEPMSAEQQFRKDYDSFQKWYQKTTEKNEQEVTALQTRLLEIGLEKNLNGEEVKSLVNNLRNTLAQSLNDLNKLNLKDPEVLNLAEKIKIDQQNIVEIIDLTIQIANKTADASAVAFDEKLKQIGTLQEEINAEYNRLKTKYQQK